MRARAASPDVMALAPVWRAYAAVWLSRAHLLRAHRHTLVSLALVVVGLGGALGGGALVGEWCLGLVLIAESAGVVWFGLQRDDGTPPERQGGRTVGEVLEVERRRPW